MIPHCCHHSATMPHFSTQADLAIEELCDAIRNLSLTDKRTKEYAAEHTGVCLKVMHLAATFEEDKNELIDEYRKKLSLSFCHSVALLMFVLPLVVDKLFGL